MPTHTSSRRDTDVDALLDRVAAGDAAAYERLYDEVSAPAYGLASRIVRDPRLAEDITQEVFLDVWRNAARFDAGRGGALTWILTIVHRRAVDAVRRSEAQRRGDVHAAGSGASVGEPADGIMQAEEHATVRDCLGALTALQRQSVRLATTTATPTARSPLCSTRRSPPARPGSGMG